MLLSAQLLKERECLDLQHLESVRVAVLHVPIVEESIRRESAEEILARVIQSRLRNEPVFI